MLKKYEDKFEIKYFRNKQKGLSLNRNAGLYHISGDVVAFLMMTVNMTSIRWKK